MDDLIVKAKDAAIKGEATFCKFLSANDSGETGANQAGILISKSACSMLFTEKEIRENHIAKKYGKIRWQDDITTNCTFTWYESKNELRLTGFGRGLSPLKPEYTGDLFILIKNTPEEFLGFILSTDDDIRDFLDSFGLTPADTNRPIELKKPNLESAEQAAIDRFISSLRTDFPTSAEMSSAARLILREIDWNHSLISRDPDTTLLKWSAEEYTLFRALENARYSETIARGFSSVDEFIAVANQVLNRRKSRAGKSLEHHLSAIFDESGIRYTEQAITEGNKKPDFLFPSSEAYHDFSFSVERLCTLAAKTTCKDRWRQVLNEANRLRDQYKYLYTMQQGISAAQMDEMQAEKVILVVPKPYIKTYPKDRQDRIWTIGRFVKYVKEMEGLC